MRLCCLCKTIRLAKPSRRIAWAIRILILLLAAWAVLIEPRWLARRDIEHAVSGWQGPDGLKVAVASDWHLTKRALWRVTTVERAKSIVGQINAAQPDVILLPGDFIADRDYLFDPPHTSAAEEIASVLGGLKARLGVYAVLGNHDWWDGGPDFRVALEKRGIRVLENEAMPLPGTKLWVAGIGDDFTGHSQPALALKKVPPGAQVLVAMHDPASLMETPRVEGLVVAGHMHGGQVALPFVGALIVPGRAPRQWAHGWIEHAGNTAYVTSGVGVSILPVRFHARPEWVMFTVKGRQER